MKVNFYFKHWFITCVITALSCFNVYCAEPYVLFGTLVSGGSSSLLTIVNQETGGIQSLIGSIGYAVNGLAYDPTTQTLYGTTSSNDPTFIGLISIDITTGAGTPIGNGWAGHNIVTLACDATGQLYAWKEGFFGFLDDLVSVDKTNGTFFHFPDAGIQTGRQGMDFDRTGTLYLFNAAGIFADDIFTINTITGLATNTGYKFSVPIGEGSVHHGKFNPMDGNFWGISSTFDARFIAIVTVDGTYIGGLPDPSELHTLAFAPLSAISPISLRGKQKQNKFLCATDYYNRLIWTNGSILGTPTAYQIYRDQSLVATLSGSSSHFEDHNRPKKRPSSYFIQAIYPNGSILLSDIIIID